MAALHLDAHLLERLEQLAAERSMPLEKFLEEALFSYLRQVEQDEMQRNILTFQEKLADLRRAYPGQFVAIYASEIVDHDSDFQQLHRRIRQRYGRQPVLIRQVTESERQWTFRSPRLEGLA